MCLQRLPQTDASDQSVMFDSHQHIDHELGVIRTLHH